MKRTLIAFLTFAIVFAPVCGAQEKVKPTKNVIFMLVDGCSTGVLSLSRWYKQYTTGTTENLALDPYLCGYVRMSHVNAPIVGSAGSMSTLQTGVLETSPNISVYPKAHPEEDMVPVDPALKYHPLVSLMDVARQEQGKRLGVVVTTTFCHATPAATAAHAASRNDYREIAAQMASMDLTCCFGGGIKYLTPKVRSILEAKGTTLIEGGDFDAFRSFSGNKLWAIMASQSMNYDIDREPGEPSLADMTSKALEMLSKDNKKGFYLMVEGSQEDFASHANDPAGIVSELLGFDAAVKVALDFARRDGNTTVVIMPDHGNSATVLGRQDFKNYSERNIATALDLLPNYKATSSKIAEMLVGKKASEIKDVIREYTSIVLTPEEEAHLISLAGVTESDYMEVGATENIHSAISKIMQAHTKVSFANTRHTGEDVFLAVYNPRDQRPIGYHTNVEINEYVRRVMGIKVPLREKMLEYYTPHTDLFPDAVLGKDSFGEVSLTVTLRDGRTAVFESNSSVVKVGDKTVHLLRPAVYIPKNNLFYLPANILSLI